MVKSGKSVASIEATQGPATEAADDDRTGAVSHRVGPTRVYIARHGERVDRIFPNWLALGFTAPEMDAIGTVAEGKTGAKVWSPYDLNLPLVLPKRGGGAHLFHNDTPITELGGLVSQLVGRGLAMLGPDLAAVYVSPALRCVQSGERICMGFGRRAPKLRVEPGLMEWLGGGESAALPDFFTPAALAAHNFPIDAAYVPQLSRKALAARRSETKLESVVRVGAVVKAIAEATAAGSKTLIVGHAHTLDAGGRKLLGKPNREWEISATQDLGLHYPFSAVLCLRQQPGPTKTWLLDQDLPPTTHFDVNTDVPEPLIALPPAA